MLSIIMLSVTMLSVIVLSIIMLSVIMLNVIVLSVIMLSAIMLSIIVLSVMMVSVITLHVNILIVVGPVEHHPSGQVVLFANPKISCQRLSDQNALAYYNEAQITSGKGFITSDKGRSF
jgi:hypothetical protein